MPARRRGSVRCMSTECAEAFLTGFEGDDGGGERDIPPDGATPSSFTSAAPDGRDATGAVDDGTDEAAAAPANVVVVVVENRVAVGHGSGGAATDVVDEGEVGWVGRGSQRRSARSLRRHSFRSMPARGDRRSSDCSSSLSDIDESNLHHVETSASEIAADGDICPYESDFGCDPAPSATMGQAFGRRVHTALNRAIGLSRSQPPPQRYNPEAIMDATSAEDDPYRIDWGEVQKYEQKIRSSMKRRPSGGIRSEASMGIGGDASVTDVRSKASFDTTDYACGGEEGTRTARIGKGGDGGVAAVRSKSRKRPTPVAIAAMRAVLAAAAAVAAVGAAVVFAVTHSSALREADRDATGESEPYRLVDEQHAARVGERSVVPTNEYDNTVNGLLPPPPPSYLAEVCSFESIYTAEGFDRCLEECIKAECCFVDRIVHPSLSCYLGREDDCQTYEEKCDGMDLREDLAVQGSA